MEGKARIIFPIVITAIIVFIVSAVAYLALPVARAVTQRLVSVIEGTS